MSLVLELFSHSEYALAARVLGLPVPQTDAECAAAAPLTSVVLKNLMKMPPPPVGTPDGNALSSVTYSLNSFPEVQEPMARDQLQHRLTAGVVDPNDEQTVAELLQVIMGDPYLQSMFLDFIANMREDSLESGEFLSQQRPLEYDMPNFGGQYSVLNAPSNSSIPASVAYSALD